jgi:mannose-6-phosphate isomerase-like protein (cupin superfamily)
MTDGRTRPQSLIRAGDAEAITLPMQAMTLLAEGGDTVGAFSVVRAKLDGGADGARPHHHNTATELFFIIDGAIDILVGDDVVTARAGDVAVAQAGVMHAFANASRTEPADVLIVFGPGIERFDYFRLLRDVVEGKQPGAEILASQERFDNWFGESAAWSAHRAAMRAANA